LTLRTFTVTPLLAVTLLMSLLMITLMLMLPMTSLTLMPLSLALLTLQPLLALSLTLITTTLSLVTCDTRQAKERLEGCADLPVCSYLVPSQVVNLTWPFKTFDCLPHVF
jgi:hypothetical protein